MLRLVIGSLSLASLAACASEASSTECALPGDIDCAAPGGADGKADGFDYKNDPLRMSQHLTYRLADLPKSGTRKTPVWKDQYPAAVGKSAPVWADTYWPTSEGSHNNRWQGAGTKSPLEKYDEVFNHAAGCDAFPSAFYGQTAKAEWDRYYTCAGPAAAWQSKNYQGGGEMHDGVDNDSDGQVDNAGNDGIDGIQSWWGTCHAWTPASLLMPEPQHAVAIDGVAFEVGDIKALLQNVFDSTSAVMLGGRCNSREIHHDATGSANDECADVNPGALHVIMTNFLGLAQLPLIEDRTANYEVWNQPVYGYQITQQDHVAASAANECAGASGNTWKYNPDAKDLYEVRMTVQYITEGYPSTTPIGFADNVRSDAYHYILEANGDGKVIGGRFCSDSENNHIDFLWSPTGSFHPTNPYVDVAKVKELVAKSVADDGGGGTGHKTFDTQPHAMIPDNDPTGVTVDLQASGVAAGAGLAVSVNIKHTFRGDLVVELQKDGSTVKTLSDRVGGPEDDLVQTYTLAPAEVGAPNGRWSLHVVDTAAQDVGTVDDFALDFGN